MRNTIAALLLFATTATAEVKTGTFASASLGKEVSFVVQVPPSYATGDKKYPVLYILHGLFENQTFWERRGLATMLDDLWAKGEAPEMLVATVDGGNSFFVNSPGGKYEDLVTRDLIAYVEANFRVVPGREGRALAGVSMGGYSALRIGLTQPGMFRAVATHSAMILEKIPTSEDGARRGQMAAFNRIFGDPIDPVLWGVNDPLAAADKADPKTSPALYFDCGSEDRYGLFTGNEDLHKRLAARHVPHEFALYPGDHGYEYVRTVLGKSMHFLAGVFREAPPAKAAAPTAPKEKK